MNHARLFKKAWKKKQQKRLMVVQKASFVKQNSSTRRQIIKVVTQNSCARFLWRNVELVFVSRLFVWGQIGLWNFSTLHIAKFCFLSFKLKKQLFASILSLLNFSDFSKQPWKTPVQITFFLFFFADLRTNVRCVKKRFDLYQVWQIGTKTWQWTYNCTILLVPLWLTAPWPVIYDHIWLVGFFKVMNSSF